MSPNFKIYLTLDGETSTATALTLGAAEAVFEQFTRQHAGNTEAFAEVRELDGTILGARVHNFWGGTRPPREKRNPIIDIYTRALRAGCRVVVGDERGVTVLEQTASRGSIAA